MNQQNYFGDIGALGGNLYQSIVIYLSRANMEQNPGIKNMLELTFANVIRPRIAADFGSDFNSMPNNIQGFAAWINANPQRRIILESGEALQNTYVPDERKKSFIGGLWDKVKGIVSVGGLLKITVLRPFKRPMITYLNNRGGNYSSSDSLEKIARAFYDKARGQGFEGVDAEGEKIAPALLTAIIPFILEFFKNMSNSTNPSEEEQKMLEEVDPDEADNSAGGMSDGIKILLAVLALLILAKVMKWI